MLSLRRICACCFLSSDNPHLESHSIEEKQENVNDITNQNLKALTDKHVLRQQIEETIKLRLVIIDSQELELGKEFEMLATGLKGPSNRVKDSCVYAGCDPEINDIILSELEKGVGKKHFMVQYDKKFKNKFALRDLGEGMGTFIRIDNQLLLKTNNIISFGDSHMIALIESNGSGKITLKFIDGPKAEQKLNDCPINIGRMADCSIRFDDSSLSRYHCLIMYSQGWYIQDGDGFKPSTNGTWLFAEEFVEVYDGMVFKAAETLFKIIVENEEKN